MKRPLRELLATCRGIWRAVSLWTWLSAGYASVVAFLSRLRASIFAFVTGSLPPSAAPAGGRTRKTNTDAPKPGEKRLWRRLKHLASTFGFPKSKPADRTSRTAPKSSKGSSSTSAARAGSRRCSSSSTTTRSRAARAAAGCWKRSFDWCRRTSTRVGPSVRFPCGPKTSWSRNCRPALRRQ